MPREVPSRHKHIDVDAFDAIVEDAKKKRKKVAVEKPDEVVVKEPPVVVPQVAPEIPEDVDMHSVKRALKRISTKQNVAIAASLLTAATVVGTGAVVANKMDGLQSGMDTLLDGQTEEKAIRQNMIAALNVKLSELDFENGKESVLMSDSNSDAPWLYTDEKGAISLRSYNALPPHVQKAISDTIFGYQQSLQAEIDAGTTMEQVLSFLGVGEDGKTNFYKDFNQDGVVDMKDVQRAVDILKAGLSGNLDKVSIGVQDFQAMAGNTNICNMLLEMIKDVEDNKDLKLTDDDKALIKNVKEFINGKTITKTVPTGFTSKDIEAAKAAAYAAGLADGAKNATQPTTPSESTPGQTTPEPTTPPTEPSKDVPVGLTAKEVIAINKAILELLTNNNKDVKSAVDKAMKELAEQVTAENKKAPTNASKYLEAVVVADGAEITAQVALQLQTISDLDYDNALKLARIGTLEAANQQLTSDLEKAKELAEDLQKELKDRPVVYDTRYETNTVYVDDGSKAKLAELQGIFDKYKIDTTAALDKLTGERDTAVGERDTALGERDTAIGERDTAIGERDTAVGERDTALGERDTAIGERDTAIGERDTAVGERDVAIGERDDYYQKWQDALAGVCDHGELMAFIDELTAQVDDLTDKLTEAKDQAKQNLAKYQAEIIKYNEEVAAHKETKSKLVTQTNLTIAQSKTFEKLLAQIENDDKGGQIVLPLNEDEAANLTPPTTTEPAAPTTTEPAAPTTTEPAAPTTTEPAAPTTTEPAAPATTEPAAPATTEPAAPATGEPTAPATTEPAPTPTNNGGNIALPLSAPVSTPSSLGGR